MKNSTPRPSKTPSKTSFRITLGGKGQVWSIADLRSMMMRAVDELELVGITHVNPCNLYIPPVDPQGTAIVRVRGAVLKDVVIAAPYRSVAEEYGI